MTFYRIVELYLNSTVVEISDDIFVQREEICIGSSVAPLLLNVYLNVLDLALTDFALSSPQG